jgi:hypothetical protein
VWLPPLERELPEVAITNESILLIVQDYWKHCKYLAALLTRATGFLIIKAKIIQGQGLALQKGRSVKNQ